MKPRIVALLPMRAGSERVPGKNHRPFAGRPLFHHVLENLLACEQIDEVVIDTDSPSVKDSTRRDFPQVRVIDRPPELGGGTVPMNAVIAHDLSQVDAEYYLQTHSTNPLLRASTIGAAIDRFLGERDTRDSLFSVTRQQKRFWWPDGTPVNHDPAVLLRTQDLPPLYEENSCIYLFGREAFLATGNRIGKRPLLFEIPTLEAWDIDEEHDFTIAELLYQAQHTTR